MCQAFPRACERGRGERGGGPLEFLLCGLCIPAHRGAKLARLTDDRLKHREEWAATGANQRCRRMRTVPRGKFSNFPILLLKFAGMLTLLESHSS
jgi:hypothetical protein